MTLSRRTSSSPPLCRYLWTSSRPVKIVPLSRKMSTAFSLHTFSAVNGLCSAIAADANAEEAGATALALRLPDRVEDAGTHAFEVPIAAFAADGHRQRILGAHVLAAAALEDQANVNRILAVLVPVKDGTAGAE